MKRITESGLKNLAGRLRTILAEALTPEEDAKFKELDTKRQTLSTSFNAIKKQYDADPTANANLKVPLAELEKQLMSIGSEISALEAKRDGTPNTQGGEKKGWAAGTLGLGSRGPEVKALQDKLIAAGLLDPTTGPGGKPANDGIFGPNTQHAVQSLQDRLGVSKDGAYGPNTQKALAAKPEVVAPEKQPVITQNNQAAEKIDTVVPPPPTVTALEPASAPAVWTPTPEQTKWLGGANQQDPIIMSRMPGTKPPVSYFKDPADQKIARGFKGLFPEAPTSGQGGERQTSLGANYGIRPPASNPLGTNLGTSALASVGNYQKPNYSLSAQNESTVLESDELNRIVSLVHHR